MIALEPRGPQPAIDEWLARRIIAGMHPKAVVVASGYRMTLRTAYRWRARIVALERVEVGGYVATFLIRRDMPPSRLTAWEPAEGPRMIPPQ